VRSQNRTRGSRKSIVGAVRELPLQRVRPGARDVRWHDARGCTHGM